VSRFLYCVLAFCLLTSHAARAQFGGPPPPDTRSPKDAARVDITGYWVAVVSEDWRFRMVTAPKGDYPNIPLNAEGRKIADAWDPAKDEAGDRCKAYGAPNLWRVPSRFHMTWADNSTLKIESDAGMQTRLIRFNATPPPNARAERQGFSSGQWEGRGALKVATSNLLPGYLQTNGVPYSARTTMTEYFDVVKEGNGDEWLLAEAVVVDPQYLFRSFIRSTHFKKQRDATGWDPSPCIVR
jgi:hypothetical protein